MQIKYLGDDKFNLKTKDSEILFSNRLVVDGFELPGAGEYEKSGAIINGINDGENTIFLISVEDIKVCHLGHINHDLSEEEAKQIGDVDILMLPLGDANSVELKVALKILSKIDPRIVIPMLYSGTQLLDFKKSEGIVDSEIDVLKIKKNELPDGERRVVILNP